MNSKAHNKRWEYLKASGVLETGTHEEIQAVKKQWQRLRDKERKRKERASKEEHTISLSRGEEARIRKEAQAHGITVAQMLHQSAFAYLDNLYVLPDAMKLFHVEALIGRLLTSLEQIARRDKGTWFLRQEDYTQIKISVEDLLRQIKEEYSTPRILDGIIAEKLKDNPAFRARLQNLLDHDCEIPRT